MPTVEQPDADRESKLQRKKDIAIFLIRYGGRPLISHFGLDSFLPEKEEKAMSVKAVEFRQDLEKLGPTFIKLGQLLSTRADLLPPEVLEQLALLEDKVTPIPFQEVRAVVETELKGRLETLFAQFDPEPIGSASLGQVHAGVLHSGRAVAVKIQRPGILPIVERDMEALYDIAEWFDRKTEFGRRTRLLKVFQEFETTLRNELDYELEADNLERLKKNLAEFRSIVIPSPVRDYCTKRVLTMDYVPGEKVTKLSPLARCEIHGDKLADALFKAYLQQVFVDGFFHADPHPGNVFLVDNDHVALIDLGMVGTFSPTVRQRLLQLLPAIYRQDADELARVAVRLSENEEPASRAALTEAYGVILRKNAVSDLKQLNVGRVILEILRVSADNELYFPPEISILGRMLLHLDRVGKVLAPDFDPNAAIERHMDAIVTRQMWHEASPHSLLKSVLEAKEFVTELPARANQLLENIIENRMRVRVDVVPELRLLENLEKIANRITVGVILAALIIGASQLMQVNTSFRLFGYPGFAMICFLLAVVGGIGLVYRIVRGDRETRRAAEKRRL